MGRAGDSRDNLRGIHFSNWNNCVDQVYLISYDQQNSPQCWRIPCLNCRIGEGWERNSYVYTSAQRPYTICVIFWEIYPNVTILGGFEVYYSREICSRGRHKPCLAKLTEGRQYFPSQHGVQSRDFPIFLSRTKFKII